MASPNAELAAQLEGERLRPVPRLPDDLSPEGLQTYYFRRVLRILYDVATHPERYPKDRQVAGNDS